MHAREDAFLFTACGDDAAAEEHHYTIALEDATIASPRTAHLGPDAEADAFAILPATQQAPGHSSAAGGAEMAMEEFIIAHEGVEFAV